jgi:predicted MFS family arabinose efflux permease
LNVSERKIVFLVGAVQFVNILDFMIVMPMGPDFAAALRIPASELGIIGGSYTAAAAVAGLAGARFLDRFERRKALAVAMLGLVVGTALAGFATGLPSLIAARVLAGAFGGPATSIALSVIADTIPPERRGKAMSAVMGAFAVASVLGVPAGLELARLGGWRAPFFAIAGLGAVVAAAAIRLMPPLRGHITTEQRTGPSFLRRPEAVLTLIAMGTVMGSHFAIVPNIAAYLQQNGGYPRDRMGLLYLVGGSVSFVSMRLVGRLVDRLGAAATAGIGTLLFLPNVAFGFGWTTPLVPAMVTFVGFMVVTSFRGVALHALASKVPAPRERARYMSAQSATQHLSMAIGAFFSASLLVERDGILLGMPQLVTFSIALALPLPLLMALVERRVKRAERTPPPAPPAAVVDPMGLVPQPAPPPS